MPLTAGHADGTIAADQSLPFSDAFRATHVPAFPGNIRPLTGSLGRPIFPRLPGKQSEHPRLLSRSDRKLVVL